MELAPKHSGLKTRDEKQKWIWNYGKEKAKQTRPHPFFAKHQTVQKQICNRRRPTLEAWPNLALTHESSGTRTVSHHQFPVALRSDLRGRTS